MTAGEWFGAAGERSPARLWADDGMLCAENTAGEQCRASFAEVQISSRLAAVPRRLTFPNGVTIVVDNNDYVDSLLPRRQRGILHRLEDHRRWLVVMIFATVAVSVLLFQMTPAAVKIVADRIPYDSLERLTEDGYQALLQHEFLIDSRLPEDDKQRVRDVFMTVVAGVEDDEYRYRIQFHRLVFTNDNAEGDDGIANALALPSGLVIVTDKSVRLLTDEELEAVFAHEIAHIRRRHGLRQFLQASGVFVFFSVVFGDVSSILSGAAALLVVQQYSQAFEKEADCAAYRYLLAHGRNEAALATALTKMEDSLIDFDDDTEYPEIIAVEEDRESELWRLVLNLLSSHPPTEARTNPRRFCAEVTV